MTVRLVGLSEAIGTKVTDSQIRPIRIDDNAQVAHKTPDPDLHFGRVRVKQLESPSTHRRVPR